MTKADDRRRGPRIKTDLATYFSAAREEGSAVLADISSVGALLERAESQPSVGARVRLGLFLPNSSKRLQVVGQVVRHTENGFAIEYESPNPHLYHVVAEDVGPVAPVEGSDQVEAATPEETAGTGAQDESHLASEDEPESLVEALEFIIAVALDGRHGSVELEDALDTIIDRAREMLDVAKARSTLKP